MPFVNIRILEGHPQERKDEIARRVTETISEVARLPKEAVWVEGFHAQSNCLLEI